VESFDPYSQWLGRPPGRPPQDHYELLGLPRFEPDLGLISHTADMLRAKIRKVRPGAHLADWQRLLDRLEAAKICLSDPIAKLAYDESIDTASHTVNVSGRHSVAWDSPEETQDTPAAETEPASPTHGKAGLGAPPVDSTPQFVEAPPALEDADHGAASRQSQTPRVNLDSSAVPASLWKSLGLRLATGALSGLLVLLVIVVGFALVQGWPTRDDTVSSLPDRGTAARAEKLDPEVDSQPTQPPSPPPSEPSNRQPPPDPIPPAPAASQASSQQMPPVAPPSPAAETPPDTSPTPPQGPAVDPARQQAYQRSITSARTALANRDLAAAANHLNEAVSLAQTPEESAEANQVEALRAHLDAFWGSLQELIPQLESGSELRVGEMMVVVVEADRDYLILRVTGQNRRYPILGMPHVLAAAVAEQILSKSPNAKALRAAFLIAEPEGDANQARRLLQEAAQGGAEVDELLAELDRPQ